MPFSPGARRISQIVIDADVDFQGKRIFNLGSPLAAGYALRHGDESLIDHNKLSNYTADRHRLILMGTLNARPTAGVSGRLYFASDIPKFTYDDGTSWKELQAVWT